MSVSRILVWIFAGLAFLWAATLLGFGKVVCWCSLIAMCLWPVTLLMVRRRRLARCSRYGSLLVPAMQVLTSGRRWADLADALHLSRSLNVRRSMLARIGGGAVGSRFGGSATRSVRYIPQVMRIDGSPCGAVAYIKGVPGSSLAIWRRTAAQLASALRVPGIAVGEPAPGVFALGMRVKDPLAQPIVLDEVVASRGFELAAGLDENGLGIYLDLRNVSGLVCGGLPGGGKTQWLMSALASFACRPEVQWLLIDGKQGHDLAVLAPRAYRYLSEDASGDLATVRDTLKEAQLLMRQRLSHSAEIFGHANLWSVGPSRTHPLVVVVIDECQQYFDTRSLITKEDKAIGAEIAAIAKDLVKRGRSAGLVTILCTQRPTADAIPTSIRDNASLRVCFGVRTRESAVAVLGEFSSESTVSPIGARTGVGVTLAGEGLVRFRAPYISEHTVAQHVSEFASLSGDPLDLLNKAMHTG